IARWLAFARFFTSGVFPVCGGAEAAHLARDGRSGLLLPLPHAPVELFAAELALVLTLRLDLPRDDHLGGDAGMVGADDPVGVEAAHAVVADERVHERLLERVAHVQGAGDVGRRKLDAIGGLGVILVAEIAGRFPPLVPGLLDRSRAEALVEHFSPFFELAALGPRPRPRIRGRSAWR